MHENFCVTCYFNIIGFCSGKQSIVTLLSNNCGNYVVAKVLGYSTFLCLSFSIFLYFLESNLLLLISSLKISRRFCWQSKIRWLKLLRSVADWTSSIALYSLNVCTIFIGVVAAVVLPGKSSRISAPIWHFVMVGIYKNFHFYRKRNRSYFKKNIFNDFFGCFHGIFAEKTSRPIADISTLCVEELI